MIDIIEQEKFMKLALVEAEKASAKEEVPVGAVIVNSDTGEVIAVAHNQCEENNNPCLHAEMIAIAEACEKLGTKVLSHCEIFISKEPCPMCATALSYVRIGHIYFALEDMKGGAFSGELGGEKKSLFDNYKNLYKLSYSFGLFRTEALDIIQAFFKARR